jgi:hypothetical protein
VEAFQRTGASVLLALVSAGEAAAAGGSAGAIAVEFVDGLLVGGCM